MMLKKTLFHYLLFLRFPSIFSSFSNVYLGYFLYSINWNPYILSLGLCAAAFSILAGMGFNDLSDFKIDSVERPNRPLPSKRVSISKGWLLCILLMTCSFFLYYLANSQSLPFVFILWICIFSYNFYFKNTRWGFVFMGLCRGFNILIGVGLSGITFLEIFYLPFDFWIYIFSLVLYISLITFLAKDETIGNKPYKVIIFVSGLIFWFISWFVLLSLQENLLSLLTGASLLIWFIFKLKPLLHKLINNPKSSQENQKIIGFCLLLIPLVDCLALIHQQSIYLIWFPILCICFSQYTHKWFTLT